MLISVYSDQPFINHWSYWDEAASPRQHVLMFPDIIPCMFCLLLSPSANVRSFNWHFPLGTFLLSLCSVLTCKSTVLQSVLQSTLLTLLMLYDTDQARHSWVSLHFQTKNVNSYACTMIIGPLGARFPTAFEYQDS